MDRRLNATERELVFELATKMTGSCQVGEYRRDVLVNNVESRIFATHSASLDAYLALAMASEQEMARLLSALTIHTTEWFRELPHYERILGRIKEIWQPTRTRSLKVLSLGCSSGEEVYSLALTFTSLQQALPLFDFQVQGWDIDPISVAKAQRAIYPIEALQQILPQYRPLILLGSGPSAGHFTLDSKVRHRCNFAVHSIDRVSSTSLAWDIIICRNVLIYFEQNRVKELVKSFAGALAPQGMLCLGHSEAIDARALGLQGQGHAIYLKDEKLSAKAAAHRIPPSPPVQSPPVQSPPVQSPPVQQQQGRHLLVIDGSRTMQGMLEKLFTHAEFTVSCASSTAAASEIIKNQKIDFVTLDINIPDDDGAAWLRQMRRNGFRSPCVIISEENAGHASDIFGAMNDGAQDFLPKELLHSAPMEVVARVSAIAEAAATRQTSSMNYGVARRESPVRSSPQAAISPEAKRHSSLHPHLLLLGASTGGTEALAKLLIGMPRHCPPVLVVQHITPSFAESFAERLALNAGLKLGAAQTGTRLQPGHLYMAFGSQHISVKRQGQELILFVSESPLVNGHRPSIDVLFSSAAFLNVPCIGVLLTGMGSDGARGLKELHDAKAFTMAQDEASCVVYGMPKEAVKLMAVDFQGNLRELRAMINQCLLAVASIKSAA